MNKICFGCGSILQSENELNPGYIPENKINEANYCKRCFRLTHYGTISDNETEKSTKNILSNINKDNIFKIYVIDLLNINNNTMDIYNKIRGNKLLIISKIDLIDKSIKINNVIERIRKIYNIKEDIKYISSNKNVGINSLLKYLESKHISCTYLLGPTNCGKSTLINTLLEMNDSKLNKVTVSNKRNTTLEFIRIKLNDKLTIIDSPGFLINDYKIKSKYKNEIKPITYNMKENEALSINDFYIKFNDSTSVTIYLYDKLDTKKYYKELDYDYNIEIEDNTDLCINGLGIIKIKNKNNICINGLDKSLLSIRKSIFGESNE